MSIRETLISARKAKALRARAERNAQWSAQFRKPNGWTVITAEEAKTCPRDARITNEERGQLEQFEVWRDKPERLFAYASADERNSVGTPYGNACKVTVWPGQPLGYGAWGKPYRDNFGGTRRSVHVRIAGCEYSGTAFVSAGDYCRLRRIKGRS